MSAARRIVLFDRVSADGYFAVPDGNLDWTVPEPALDAAGAASLSGADTMLFGRRTYDMFESFWPHAIDDAPTAPDPHGPGRSPELRAMGQWINDATKIVFSTTRTAVTWKGSRLVSKFEPSVVEAIKREPGKDIMVFGSGTIASLLAAHGLIDDYVFIVGPLLLAGGRSLFTKLPKMVRLELREATAFPSGNVRLRYTAAR